MILAALAAAVTTGTAAAQPGSGQASIDDLKAPASPAFVVLDVAPTKVERPQAVRPLVLSALAAAGDNGLPSNYAVEFAPYWLGTPEISFDQYYRPGARALLQHLSISVGTSPMKGSDAPGTAIGMGARTLALPGRPHPQLTALRKKLVSTQAALRRSIGSRARRTRLISLLRGAQRQSTNAVTEALGATAFSSLVDELIKLDDELLTAQIRRDDVDAELADLQRLPENQRKARQAELEKQGTELDATIKDLTASQQKLVARTGEALAASEIGTHLTREAQLNEVASRLEQAQTTEEESLVSQLRATALKIQALDNQRVGPMLALAGALAWRVPDDDSAKSTLSKVALWATPGYRIAACGGAGADDESCATSLDALAVIRYLDDRTNAEDGVWELGARVVWQPIAPLAVSAEWLGRAGSNTETDAGTRVVGLAEYRVTETIYLHASFGRDFKDLGTNRSLVSVVGLTFGFGSKPIITP
jgi:hypothetical protein